MVSGGWLDGYFDAMSKDAFGNYIALPGGVAPGSVTPSISIPLAYAGNPNGAVTEPIGTVLIDTTNNQWWINTDGGTTWVGVAAGGGSGLIAPGVVNPNGNITAAAGSTYFNTNNSTFWEKASGSGNTGWIQLI